MTTNNKKTNRTRKCVHGGGNDIVLEYSKQPILSAAYSYHPAYYVDVYGSYRGFIEPSKVLTFSQGTHFSKVKIYKKTNCLETENDFEELHAGKCMLKKGNILSVAPSPVSNKLRKTYLPGEKGKPCKEWFTYINTGLAFDSGKAGAHLNKTALGTDNNSIIIVCNEFCWAKAKNANGKEYEICQPKVLGDPTMRGGYGSDSDEESSEEEESDSDAESSEEEESDSDEESSEEEDSEEEEEENSEEEEEDERRRKWIDEEHAKLDQEEVDRNNEKTKQENERKKAAEEETAKATEKKKKEQEETEKLNTEEAWDAEEEKYKPPKKVKSVNLEKRIALESHTGPVNALAWNSKGTKLVSGSSDTTLRMWSYVETNNIQLPEFEDFAKTDAARKWAEIKIKNYSPKSHERGIIGRNWNEINEQNIKFHLFNNGHESLRLIVKNGVNSYSPQEDGVAKKAYDTWLAPSLKKYNDELKTAWELEEWKCDWISKQETSYGFPRYHVGPILSVSWSPDDKHIASGSEDNHIMLWDPENGKFYQKLEGHKGPVRSLVWSYDSTILYSCSDDGTVKIWKKKDQKFTFADSLDLNIVDETKGPLVDVKLLCVAVNEKYIIAGSNDGIIYVWDVTTNKLLLTLPMHDGAVTSLFWQDPRDPSTIVDQPIDPNTKKPYDKPIPLLVKDPETFISTSLDKTIKIIHLEPHMKKNADRQVRNKKSITKKFMGEVVPMVLGRPAMGTDPGGLHYRQKVKEIDDELLESLQSNPVRGEIHEKTVRLNAIKDQIYKTEGEDEERIEKLKDDEKKLEVEIKTLQETLKPLLKPKVEGGSKNKKGKVTKKHRAKRSMNTQRRK